MRSVESDGDSIDQAIDQALRTLGVERDQVDVEILADVQRGLFGFGGKKARVRATVRAPLVARLSDVSSMTDENDSRETSPVGDAEIATRAKKILEDLLTHLGVSCSVAARRSEDPGVAVILDVMGDSSGLLIGRRGQTLDALDYMINRIVGRDGAGATGRVSVDIERYRERRREYLVGLAQRLADKVRKSGRVVTLNPMSPRDRRIVHLALHDDPTVVTRSHGEGHFRKIVIAPGGERPRRGNQGRPAS
jgi:spoIIIJ-associated protein